MERVKLSHCYKVSFTFNHFGHVYEVGFTRAVARWSRRRVFSCTIQADGGPPYSCPGIVNFGDISLVYAAAILEGYFQIR